MYPIITNKITPLIQRNYQLKRLDTAELKQKFKGVVAQSAFQHEFGELHIFFLFNSLNYIYRTYIGKNFNFLPRSFENNKT